MYSRVMLLEIDTLRVAMSDALDLFKVDVLPRLREWEGYEGVLVLTTPEGKAMIVTFWESEDAAINAAAFGTGALAEHAALFKAPPGRDHYEVSVLEAPGVNVARE